MSATDVNTDLARKYEFYETPRWAVEAILDVELLTRLVWDPCCGRGVMSDAASARGYVVRATDIVNWGAEDFGGCLDFLEAVFPPSFGVIDDDDDEGPPNFTIFMNPPFSLAVDFVEQAFHFRARKIVCFQRFAWWESRKRREFWGLFPPNRIYICGDRATCWRGDIPEEERQSGALTAHAWYVWERGHPHGTMIGHIYRDLERGW